MSESNLNLVELRKFALEMAVVTNPKDAGQLISRASGIYRWLMTNEKEADNGEGN